MRGQAGRRGRRQQAAAADQLLRPLTERRRGGRTRTTSADRRDIESILGLFGARGAHRADAALALPQPARFADRRLQPRVLRRPPGRLPQPRRGSARRRAWSTAACEDASTTAAGPGPIPRRPRPSPRRSWSMRASNSQSRREQRDTLGVAAFSVAQMDAILDQLELLRRAGPGVRGVLRLPAARAVLRQEPGERPGRRARRDLHQHRLRADRRRATWR